MMRLWIAVGVSVLWVGLVWGQIYKWTDSQGIAHFTDDPSRIPAPYRSTVEVEKAVAPPVPAGSSHDDTKSTPAELGPSGESPSTGPLRDRLGRGPDYWRALAQQWSDKLQQLNDERDRLQSQYHYTRQLADATRDVWDRGRLETEATRLEKAIAAAEVQIKEAEIMLRTTLPLEAVQVGADPDWLKPPAATRE
jgi:hypothetical protein